MPRRRHHPSHPPAPPRVRSASEALAVVHAALRTRPATACLLLDEHGRGGTCVVIEGGADFGVLARFWSEAAADLRPGAAGQACLVLATDRPGSAGQPTPVDLLTYFELRLDLLELGVELLDWFLLDGEVATSLAERCDVPVPWSG